MVGKCIIVIGFSIFYIGNQILINDMLCILWRLGTTKLLTNINNDILIVLVEKPLEFLINSSSLKSVTENRSTSAQIVVKVELFELGELSDEQHGEGEVMVNHSVRIGNPM